MAFPVIDFPSKRSEFELQAELFFALKAKGYDVRGEVTAKFEGQNSTFDLVIFNCRVAAVIIEVKNSNCKGLLYGKKTRQSVKYKSYGIPVVFYTTATPLELVMEQIDALLRN